MQNNVRDRTLTALLCSVLLCAALFVWLCLPLPNRDIILLADQAYGEMQDYTEKDGVKYAGSGFTVTDFSRTVERGKTAHINVSAKTGTTISISAYYKSGLSESDAFVPKTSFGGTSWEWKVPENTTSDSIRIVLRSNDTYATLDILIA